LIQALIVGDLAAHLQALAPPSVGFARRLSFSIELLNARVSESCLRSGSPAEFPQARAHFAPVCARLFRMPSFSTRIRPHINLSILIRRLKKRFDANLG